HLPEAHASAGWQLGVILTISLMISINYGSNEFVERRTIVWLVPAAACLVIAWRSHRKSEVQA
ncbi:MAG: hypothetical protein KDA85_07635, partial [Planctomycetaceae bacterium]|nr:hypothetical protein [Planctomycetaceae bacterium]